LRNGRARAESARPQQLKGAPMPSLGTRSHQQTPNNAASTRGITETYTRDSGMTKNVSGSFTFVNSTTNQVQGANGTFTAFVANDVVMVEGVNLNNGTFTVTGIDSTNHAYLVLGPGVKNEGPITCTIRTV